MLESEPVSLNTKQDKYREQRQTVQLLFLMLTLACNLTVKYKQMQHTVLSAFLRSEKPVLVFHCLEALLFSCCFGHRTIVVLQKI